MSINNLKITLFGEPTPKRFLNKLKAINDCIVWMGALNAQGYGLFGVGTTRKNFVTKRVHRLSYLWFVGPLKQNITLHHLCNNKNCIKPQHLLPIPLSAHIRMETNKNNRYTNRTHCKNGHEFSITNTKIRRGFRECIQCTKIASAKQYNKKKSNGLM